ncbi:hypothetical protein HanPI659440_Chr16g0649681 [Helianthus annuus]|nr:hypothetical protein HanPI659440_Chr16g0649681 [Helianthus annuus]
MQKPAQWIRPIKINSKPRISYTREFLLSLSELDICKSLPSGFDQSKSTLRKPRISYTKDFLLSLSELEICKSLPSGFDQIKSILSEFEENSIQERPRTHRNFQLQGLRRTDCSSSPPTRGDSSNISRGAFGRWDNRSSGWGDKDGDAQSDLDPDSGRRNHGNHSRRPWQNSEHDGLLGSGTFPRPLGLATGTSASKGPTNRSTGAYQPPRPFKAVPRSRPNTLDSFNDETFGTLESTNQDRSEEERKRRASFELMRKEQQKVLQEKQKTSASKVNSDGFTDLILEEAKEERVSEASGALNSAVQSVPKDDSGKPNILLQSSKSRPPVPPRFKSTVLEKSSTTKPISFTEKEKVRLDDSLSPRNVESSRFARWFNEDEKKPVDDFLPSRTNYLLSLIGGGEKAGPNAPEKNPRISYTRDFHLSLSELEICKSLPSGFDQSKSILRKPRISYTRDFLLSLSELEICKSLPSGFDQSKSILRKPGISYTRDFLLTLSELEICKSLLSGFDQSKSIPRKPRISYTRDFLLSLSELDICKSLPSGFDQSKSILRKPGISYTRDFLLSLSELEMCKSLPSGFDQIKSILSAREFEENIIQERPRTHRNFPLQGLRRNDYSSSPPTRGDSSNISRGAFGRWDNCSSGWGDKDGDAQSDLDPDSGRRNHGNHSRRPWQNSERDGLLGSGSFPRPLGLSSGTSASKGPTNRSTEAVPHSRPNTHDSFNDETFGPLESTNQDRSEEERKRRASFELMRKEQQKVLQEKQKTSASKVNSDGFTDLILEEAKEERVSEASGALNSAVQSVPKDDSGKPNILLQSSKSRPPVPPRFKSTVLEKSSTTKPISFTEKEVKLDDSLSPPNVESSRFAHWFNEDEKKPVDDFLSSRTNDLLSLIGGGEKAGPNTPELSYKTFGITKTPSDPKHMLNSFGQESAPPPVAAVLTCEDIEQTIMSEYCERSSNFQPPVQENVDTRAVDSQATHHLLSLLQKGTVSDDGPNTSFAPVGPVDARSTSGNPKDGNNQEVANSGQNLSLEALFGTAFMKELQSAQAPVSAQRAPPSVSNVDGMGPAMKFFETKQPAKSDDPENWLHFDGQRVEVDPSVFSKQTSGTGEIHLPEEENFIFVGDAANTRNSNIGLNGDVAFDISEKLAVNSSGFGGCGPYDMLEPERQVNKNQNPRPKFHPSDTNPQHMNSQMRFLDHLMQRDARVSGFDVNANIHGQMLSQMRMQGNFQSPQLLLDLQRPQASNFTPDHGFPFANQQMNIGGPGLPLSVADDSNHPEAFQRMVEMGLRPQSKQVRSVSGHGLDMGFR